MKSSNIKNISQLKKLIVSESSAKAYHKLLSDASFARDLRIKEFNFCYQRFLQLKKRGEL